MTRETARRFAHKTGVSRRTFLGATASTIATLTLVGLPETVRAQEDLAAIVWCDHSDPSFLDGFAGARVRTKDYDAGTGAAISVIEQSQPGDWDIFVLDSVDVPWVAESGLLSELNADDYPMGDIFEQVRQSELHTVGGALYAVPTTFGYNGICYNSGKVDPADMRRMSVLWDPKYEGRIAVYDYYIPIIQLVGIGLGIAPHEVSIENLPLIGEKLFEMKKKAVMIGDVVSVQTALVSGDADIIAGGSAWTVASLRSEHPEVHWVLPDEGGLRWTTAAGVISSSNKKELAQEFIQYMLSPAAQADLATAECYWKMPANSKAGDHLNAADLDSLHWDRQADFLSKSHNYFIGGADLDNAMLNLWSEFLAA